MVPVPGLGDRASKPILFSSPSRGPHPMALSLTMAAHNTERGLVYRWHPLSLYLDRDPHTPLHNIVGGLAESMSLGLRLDRRLPLVPPPPPTRGLAGWHR